MITMKNNWEYVVENIYDLPKIENDDFNSALQQFNFPKINIKEYFCFYIRLLPKDNKIISIKSINIDKIVKVKYTEKKSVICLYGKVHKKDKLNLKIKYLIKDREYEISKEIEISDPSDLVDLDFNENSKTLFDPLNINVGDEIEPIESKELIDSKYLRDIEVSVNIDGIEAKFIKDTRKIKLSGTPKKAGELILLLNYKLSTYEGVDPKVIKRKIGEVAEDSNYKLEAKFKEFIENIELKKVTAEEENRFEIDLINIDNQIIEILGLELKDDKNESIENIDLKFFNNKIKFSGKIRNNNKKAIENKYIVIKYNLKTKLEGTFRHEISQPFIIVTPNPRDLWEDKETDKGAEYCSKNEAFECISPGSENKTILAASKRGRSHAHYGKFRDDNFKIKYLSDLGWYIVAISDGAGSAEYSREGSRLVCDTFCEDIKNRLEKLEEYKSNNSLSDEKIKEYLENSAQQAAHKAFLAVFNEAEKQSRSNREYAATLLAYIMKKQDDKWLVVSFGVGDGIIACLQSDSSVSLLTKPDGGEFVGQTRFVTMKEVWKPFDAARINVFEIEDSNFKAIISMTDGVSDPEFETDANLEKKDKWNDLFQKIEANVSLDARSKNSAEDLLKWLDFWAVGHHDDRTITIAY